MPALQQVGNEDSPQRNFQMAFARGVWTKQEIREYADAMSNRETDVKRRHRHARFAVPICVLFGAIVSCASAQPVPPPSRVQPPVILPPSGEHRMIIPQSSSQCSPSHNPRHHVHSRRKLPPAPE